MTGAVPDQPGMLITPELRALAALRSMVIGAVGLLGGGILLLCGAFDLGGPLTGATDLQRLATMVMAGAIAPLGAISLVRALVVREELRNGADGPSIVLVTLATVPLAVLALAGYSHTRRPPDRGVHADALPYTFEYPGTWQPNPYMQSVERQGYSDVLGLAVRTTPDPGQGVLVVAFVPESRSRLEAWVRKAGGDGVRVANERTVQLDGVPGLMVDYQREPGKPFQSQAAVMRDGVAYVVTCFVELEPAEAIEGCREVLDTFEFTR
jgi:hypothetical protein